MNLEEQIQNAHYQMVFECCNPKNLFKERTHLGVL